MIGCFGGGSWQLWQQLKWRQLSVTSTCSVWYVPVGRRGHVCLQRTRLQRTGLQRAGWQQQLCPECSTATGMHQQQSDSSADYLSSLLMRYCPACVLHLVLRTVLLLLLQEWHFEVGVQECQHL